MTKISLILRFSALLLAICLHGNAFAHVNPINFLRSGYLYYDEDIRTILQTRLDARTTYVAPALPFESQALIRDIIRDAANSIPNVGNAAVIPINFGNAHWAALAIKRNANGSLRAIYTDSTGGALNGHGANATLLRNELQRLVIQITDLQLHQQSDGSSCGAFTAENLIKIAELDLSGLTDNQIRNALASINNATAIRNSHFLLLYTGNEIFDVNLLKPRSENAANKLKSQHQVTNNTIRQINGLIHDRLNGQNHFSAIAAGDESTTFGVWVKGLIGSGSDKNTVNNSNVPNALHSKSAFHGLILGADAEISEGLILGAAFSQIESKAKYTLEGTPTNTDTVSNKVFTLYGSDYIDDDISLNGSMSFGNIVIKTKDQTLADSARKQKGNLVSASLVANYKLYSNEFIAVTPRVGSTLNTITLNGYEGNSIKISKSKQRELELSAGTELSALYNARYLRLMPKVSADYAHVAWNQGNNITIDNMIDQNIINQKSSTNKGTLKFGVGVKLETDNIEISNGYEYSAQGKNQNHMGYAKFRVNF